MLLRHRARRRRSMSESEPLSCMLTIGCSFAVAIYPQTALYKRCLERFGPRHKYMAFIDTDEVGGPADT